MIEKYSNIAVGVDCVILTTDFKSSNNIRMNDKRQLQVLLIKRGIEPYQDMWSLPGGLVERDKSLQDTVNEKLLGKANIDNIYTEQLYTYGDIINRDPRGRVVSVAYLALVDKTKFTQIKSKEYGEVKWFNVWIDKSGNLVICDDNDEIIKELAFDHSNIIKNALNRLSGKIGYTDIAFKLLPEKFTIRELQDVYEGIMCKTIYSFRKYIENKVEETLEVSSIRAHRPAKLYRYHNREE